MKKKTLRVEILTIFPEIIASYVEASILGRAGKSGLLKVNAVQLRDFTSDRHRTVDDRPFGGGPGMLLKIEPFHKALISLKLRKKDGKKTAAAKKTRVILTSAKGKMFTQKDAVRLSKFDRLVFLCGRYEGVDERVAARLADEEFSIGSYVLTGGELAALVMVDAIVRNRPGVLGRIESLNVESWSCGGELEYPQYTRPENYLGWNVPKVLLSGDHKRIAEWRKKNQTAAD